MRLSAALPITNAEILRKPKEREGVYDHVSYWQYVKAPRRVRQVNCYIALGSHAPHEDKGGHHDACCHDAHGLEHLSHLLEEADEEAGAHERHDDADRVEDGKEGGNADE